MKPELRPAQAADLPAVVELLSACGLPSSDLTAASLAAFHVAEVGGRLVGVAGLEVAGGFALLRSVAVAPDFRARGVARQLVTACEDHARTSQLLALYLIAGNAHAADYFARAGYAAVTRAQVPPALRVLPEFSHLCPQSSPCLRKILSDQFDEASFMKKLEIYDPAMCCSTGVCGVDVDPVLVQFAADLQWAAEQGVDVKRYNLGQEPQAFAANPAVIKEMEAGMDRLPIIVVDGRIVSTGVHLSRAQLAQKLDITLATQDKPRIKIGSGCCSPKSGCC
jgi:N-acetylglutamate synthase-like GNAT family acetyltransferase